MKFSQCNQIVGVKVFLVEQKVHGHCVVMAYVNEGVQYYVKSVYST